MEEWKEYRLGELLTIKYGKDHKKLHDGSIPAYGSGGIMRYVNKSIYEHSSILIPRKGSLNNIIYIGTPFWTVDTMFWTIINTELVNPKYLYYAICKFDFAGLNVGSAVPSLTVPVIENIKITLPSLNKQKRIANILSSLDDKIELNRRINENLEQQAQALFKSWFVNFEPFKDGQFVDSELGKIPEGWKVGNLEELVEVKYGKDHKKLTSGTIPVYGSGGIMRYVDQYLYNKESVLIPRKGSLNNVMYINRPFWTVDTMFYTCMKIEGIAKFIYLFMSPKDLLSMNSGSAVPSMTVDILNKIQIITPPINILQKFECIMKPIFTKMDLCSYENQKLSQLRNTLLPRLMSGKLEIKDNSYD